jgi:DnaK suppressor protein
LDEELQRVLKDGVMTTSVPIDKYVLLQFRNGLREQQRELQETIARVEKEIRDVVDSTADNMDLSCCNATKESMAARNSQNRRKLKLVDLALDRIQDGSFGTCAACGDAIGLKRLQAVPSASHCIECQEGLERGALKVVPGPTPALELMQNSGS